MAQPDFNAWYDSLTPAEQALANTLANTLAACFLLAALEETADGSRPDPDAISERAHTLFARLVDLEQIPHEDQPHIDQIAGELLADLDWEL